jgi:hypothetical protein
MHPVMSSAIDLRPTCSVPVFAPVDGQVEHGEVARSALDHQVRSDRPDVLWSQRGLRADQLALVPGRAGWPFQQTGLVV